MQTIYKYKIEISDEFELELPFAAQILSFQTQNGFPCIWALVDLEATKVKRRFRIYGTGHPIEKIPKDVSLHFIGITQQSDFPPLVWHLFEERKS